MMGPLPHFAAADQGPPGEAMRAALEAWDECAPRLLEVLDAFAEGRDRSEAAARIVCHAVYLAAQRRERRAFPALCHLACDNDALERAIGDGITEDFAAILAQTFDGDRERLRALILDEVAGEFVRYAALIALARLFAEGVLPPEEAEAYLRDLHDRMLSRDEPDWIWAGWQQAVSALGLVALRPQAAALFRSGRIDRSIMERKDFEADLRAGTAPGVDRPALLARHGAAPIEDAPRMFEAWHRTREEEARRPPLAPAPDLPGPGLWTMPPEPAVNRYREVGRNDPCPCGSGRKFKKCCLPA